MMHHANVSKKFFTRDYVREGSGLFVIDFCLMSLLHVTNEATFEIIT